MYQYNEYVPREYMEITILSILHSLLLKLYSFSKKKTKIWYDDPFHSHKKS